VRILLTAFEPYDNWDQNSSWEALICLLERRGAMEGVTTRRYPVDLPTMQERLFKDLARGFDAVLHLGQSPGASRIQLEAIALNVAGMTESQGEFFGPITQNGPVAFRTDFPLDLWKRDLMQNGIPSAISFHAGTYLCNAVMYLSHLWHLHHQLRRPIGFMHIPLTPEQVLRSHRDLPSMPREQAAEAIGRVVDLINSHDFEPQFA
jgi:pyroglutamyl-peptidase